MPQGSGSCGEGRAYRRDWVPAAKGVLERLPEMIRWYFDEGGGAYFLFCLILPDFPILHLTIYA